MWSVIIYQSTYIGAPNLPWHTPYLDNDHYHCHWLRLYPQGLEKLICRKEGSSRPYHQYWPWYFWIEWIHTGIWSLDQLEDLLWNPDIPISDHQTEKLVQWNPWEGLDQIARKPYWLVKPHIGRPKHFNCLGSFVIPKNTLWQAWIRAKYSS